MYVCVCCFLFSKSWFLIIAFFYRIGCENETCEREWFHYECVGITEAPEGSWYCKDCLKKLQKKWIHMMFTKPAPLFC